MSHQGIEIPPCKRPVDDNGYFEELTKAVFRAGFSWRVIHDKWPHFRVALDNFDIQVVASYDEIDLDRLLSDPGIVRNGRKIEATVYNARVMQEITFEHGSFFEYLRSLDDLSYAQRRQILCDLFHSIGPTSVFVFLYSVDEDVPSWEDRNK